MSNNVKEEIYIFLKNAKLSSYEINTFITLLYSKELTAKEISERARVPTGRIYEILEGLHDIGMIEIHDSRPKVYRSLPFNTAFENLISYKENERKKESAFLTNQAQALESKLYNSDLYIKKEPSKVFWSTAFGVNSIFSLYVRHANELKKELLITGFLNENTLKIIRFAKDYYEVIYKAVQRGVKVKYLWSFDHDERALSTDEKSRCETLYNELIETLEKYFNISLKMKGFEMKYIYKRFPTYYDIFDNQRVLIKLQNPLQISRIFACMNVLDTTLAEALREKFLNTWLLEAIEI